MKAPNERLQTADNSVKHHRHKGKGQMDIESSLKRNSPNQCEK